MAANDLRTNVKEFIMKHKIATAALFALLGVAVGCSQQKAHSNTQSRQAASLRELRDTGVLSQQEYEQKLKQLRFGHAAPAAGGSTRIASSPANGHVWKMRKVDITTPVNDLRTNGTIKIQGMTMLVPEDWKFQGNPTFPSKLDCSMTNGRFNLLATSPDKTTGLQVVALGTSIWSTNRAVLQQIDQGNRAQFSFGNCSIQKTKGLAEGLPEAVPILLPGGQVVGQLEPVPGLNDRLAASVEQANQQLGRSGAHISAEAGRLRVKGTIDGKSVEAWFIALHTVRSDPAPGGGVNELSDIPLFAVMFAPAGQLDGQEKMLSAMLDSIQINPEWTNYIAQYTSKLVQIRQRAMNQVSQTYANMAQDNARAAAQQQQIRNGVQQYSNQVHQNVASNRAAALDNSSQQFALHMGDQAIYSDPTTGQRVQLSNQYGHAWANTTGNTNEYILTDSPSYNPNGHAGSGTWTEMQEVK